MTYWALNAAFLAVVALVALAAALSRATGRSPRWSAIGLVAAVLLALTAVFDNLMIGAGLVAYAADRTSGVLVGIAPIEDFAYAIAAAVLAPSLWCLLARKTDDD